MATLGQYNLEEMTAQEVVEAAGTHLFEQSDRSLNGKGDCVYNGDSVCCAAGIFVQDYRSDMETIRWADLVENFKQSDFHTDLVSELQRLHDRTATSHWLFGVEDLCKSFKLDNSFLIAWYWDDTKQRYIKKA